MHAAPGSDKRSMNLTKVLRLGLSLVFLTGCHAVYSTHPVGDAPVAVSPDDWEGTWVHRDGALTVAVLDPEKGVLEIGWVEKKQERLKLERYKVLLRKSGEWLFGSVQDPDKPKLYVWGRIKNADGQIVLWAPDVQKAMALVEKGVLPGHVEKMNDVSFTDPEAVGPGPIPSKESDVVLTRLGATELKVIMSGETGGFFDWERPLVFRRLTN
jgi:hypothetical protein